MNRKMKNIGIGVSLIGMMGVTFCAVVRAHKWKSLCKRVLKEDQKLMEEYDVDKDRASSDIDKFVSKLKSEDLLED